MRTTSKAIVESDDEPKKLIPHQRPDVPAELFGETLTLQQLESVSNDPVLAKWKSWAREPLNGRRTQCMKTAFGGVSLPKFYSKENLFLAKALLFATRDFQQHMSSQTVFTLTDHQLDIARNSIHGKKIYEYETKVEQSKKAPKPNIGPYFGVNLNKVVAEKGVQAAYYAIHYCLCKYHGDPYPAVTDDQFAQYSDHPWYEEYQSAPMFAKISVGDTLVVKGYPGDKARIVSLATRKEYLSQNRAALKEEQSTASVSDDVPLSDIVDFNSYVTTKEQPWFQESVKKAMQDGAHDNSRVLKRFLEADPGHVFSKKVPFTAVKAVDNHGIERQRRELYSYLHFDSLKNKAAVCAGNRARERVKNGESAVVGSGGTSLGFLAFGGGKKEGDDEEDVEDDVAASKGPPLLPNHKLPPARPSKPPAKKPRMTRTLPSSSSNHSRLGANGASQADTESMVSAFESFPNTETAFNPLISNVPNNEIPPTLGYNTEALPPPFNLSISNVTSNDTSPTLGCNTETLGGWWNQDSHDFDNSLSRSPHYNGGRPPFNPSISNVTSNDTSPTLGCNTEALPPPFNPLIPNMSNNETAATFANPETLDDLNQGLHPVNDSLLRVTPVDFPRLSNGGPSPFNPLIPNMSNNETAAPTLANPETLDDLNLGSHPVDDSLSRVTPVDFPRLSNGGPSPFNPLDGGGPSPFDPFAPNVSNKETADATFDYNPGFLDTGGSPPSNETTTGGDDHVNVTAV